MQHLAVIAGDGVQGVIAADLGVAEAAAALLSQTVGLVDRAVQVDSELAGRIGGAGPR